MLDLPIKNKDGTYRIENIRLFKSHPCRYSKRSRDILVPTDNGWLGKTSSSTGIDQVSHILHLSSEPLRVWLSDSRRVHDLDFELRREDDELYAWKFGTHFVRYITCDIWVDQD